jgi:hypothetical protein
MNIQLPLGQLLLQQSYLDGNLMPTHQSLQLQQQQQRQQQQLQQQQRQQQQLQQQNFNQELFFPIQEKPTLGNTELIKPKRKQVKNACGKSFTWIFLE